MSPPAVPYCLDCGYDRTHLDSTARCPECGAEVDPRAARERCEAHFTRWARRTARNLAGRRAPPGWWTLLDATRLRLRARLQLVLGLAASVLVLGVFLGVGSHVVVTSDYEIFRGPISLQAGTNAYRPTRLTLAAIVRSDSPWRSPLLPLERIEAYPPDQVPPTPTVELSGANWSPYLVAQVAWLSCAPALAFLLLRFALVPLAMRIGNGGRVRDERAAAAIAADASIGSCALAFAIAFVIGSIACFVVAAILPSHAAAAVARSAPGGLATLYFLLPALLVANEIRSDTSRRVYPMPAWSAVAAGVLYVVGIAGALIAMGLVFRFATWMWTRA